MQANFNNFTKAFLSGAILGGLGFSTVTVLAEQVPGYCGIVLCSSSAAASFTKQKLGLGDASLGWWDCRIQGKCQDVQKDIQKLKMTAQDCTYDKLVSFKEDISALDTKLGELVAKFGTKGREAVGYDMRDGLTDDLLSHYKQCYAEGLFKPDRNSCITANCSKKVAEIEKLEVSSDNCKIQLRTLYPHASQTWDFGYEKELVTSKDNEFKENCIDASRIHAPP
ncbi:MAG: hypothetical protein LUC43_07745, partial [Burkholderiales bacterium]|nr:hypothetical protein [Burkholderiales bacterium]